MSAFKDCVAPWLNSGISIKVGGGLSIPEKGNSGSRQVLGSRDWINVGRKPKGALNPSNHALVANHLMLGGAGLRRGNVIELRTRVVHKRVGNLRIAVLCLRLPGHGSKAFAIGRRTLIGFPPEFLGPRFDHLTIAGGPVGRLP